MNVISSILQARLFKVFLCKYESATNMTTFKYLPKYIFYWVKSTDAVREDYFGSDTGQVGIQKLDTVSKKIESNEQGEKNIERPYHELGIDDPILVGHGLPHKRINAHKFNL